MANTQPAFMLEAGISNTRLIGRFSGIVSQQVDDRRFIAVAPDGGADPRPQLAEAAVWPNQVGVQKTIDALRRAGLMK